MEKKISIPKTDYEIMQDMLMILSVLAVAAIYYYGARAAVIISLSALCCVITDMICVKLRHKDIDKKDVSALVTGMEIGLMMSAAVPYYVVIIADIFAVVLVKHAFGGRKREIFSCSAVGFLFVALSFPGVVLSYPKPFTYLPAFSYAPNDTVLYSSLTKSVTETELQTASVVDLLIGKFCGPMGTGFMIILLIAAVFLVLRRSVSGISFFTQLAIVFGYSFVYYDFNAVKTFNLLSCGMIVFGIIFLSCDFATIPKTHLSRFLYGIVMGVLILVFQFYAKVENAVVYAAIIAAPIGIALDKRALSFANMLKKGNKLMLGLNKDLKNIDETITLINGSEKDGNGDQTTDPRKD